MNNLCDAFLSNMKQLLGDEYNAFLESLNQPNEKAIFVNTNKISVEDFLQVADFPVEKIKYENCGFYIGNRQNIPPKNGFFFQINFLFVF